MLEVLTETADAVLLLLEESHKPIHCDAAVLRALDLPVDNDVGPRALAVGIDKVVGFFIADYWSTAWPFWHNQRIFWLLSALHHFSTSSRSARE